MDWFANGFRNPKTRRELSATTIDSIQDTRWDKPFDDLPPTYVEYVFFPFAVTY